MRQSVVRFCGAALFALSPALFAVPSPVPHSPIPTKPLRAVTALRPMEPKIGGNCWARLQSCNAGCAGDNNCLLACDCDYSFCANLDVPQNCGGPAGGN
jgi:hypothetical protein